MQSNSPQESKQAMTIVMACLDSEVKNRYWCLTFTSVAVATISTGIVTVTGWCTCSVG